MDFGPLRTLVLDLNREVHGVDTTVTLPDEDPIETRGIWLTPETVDFPASGELRRREPQRVMALGKDEVPRIVRGTIVLAPEKAGGEVLRWRVDGTFRVLADQHQVYLVPDPEPES